MPSRPKTNEAVESQRLSIPSALWTQKYEQNTDGRRAAFVYLADNYSRIASHGHMHSMGPKNRAVDLGHSYKGATRLIVSNVFRKPSL